MPCSSVCACCRIARGWRAMILDEGATSLFDGTAWRDGMVTLSPHNAGLSFGVAEIDHVIASGPTSTTVVVIPAPSVVIGVTARVTQAITGTLASWTLGTAVSPGQFGTGLGLATGSWCRGLLGQPTAYYLPEALQLDGTGGDFSGGTIRIAVHFMEIALPDQ